MRYDRRIREAAALGMIALTATGCLIGDETSGTLGSEPGSDPSGRYAGDEWSHGARSANDDHHSLIATVEDDEALEDSRQASGAPPEEAPWVEPGPGGLGEPRDDADEGTGKLTQGAELDDPGTCALPTGPSDLDPNEALPADGQCEIARPAPVLDRHLATWARRLAVVLRDLMPSAEG